MGFALGGWAVAVEGSAPMVVVGWTALALAGLAAEQLGGRPGGRIAALGLALLAFPCLFGFAREEAGGMPPLPGPALEFQYTGLSIVSCVRCFGTVPCLMFAGTSASRIEYGSIR